MKPEWKADIDRAVEVLKEGGLILYPTDTVWGIGCDARNPEAVKRIYELKQRDDSKSMIVLLDADAKLNQYLKEVPDVAWDLLDAAVNPMTIIYPGAIKMAENVIAADGTIAIRLVTEGFCHAMLHKFRFPVVSTSANISGSPTPRAFADIRQEIIDGVDYVVNLGRDQKNGPPSTIIKLGVNGDIEIVRK